MAAIVYIVCLFAFSFSSLGEALSLNYYDKTCPNAEAVITSAVKKAMSSDRTVPAALLRMHFHDCFIRGDLVCPFFCFQGCDASVLLKSVGQNTAEKDGPPNISLHAFYVIDNAKKAIESVCPGVVSCADILALAARDAVTLTGGPTWNVPKGRKDGRVSKATETRGLPAPTFNISQLHQSFSQRGLSMKDLVALSGDPTLSPSFAASLKNVCPSHNKAKNAGATMDPSSATFDNTYFKLLLQGKSLFSSDEALLTTPKTKALVFKFASSQQAFADAFVKSMIKMGSINGGQEVRLDCKVVN
ncbi:peroxidase [Ranunculus cassubicifolius]